MRFDHEHEIQLWTAVAHYLRETGSQRYVESLTVDQLRGVAMAFTAKVGQHMVGHGTLPVVHGDQAAAALTAEQEVLRAEVDMFIAQQ